MGVWQDEEKRKAYYREYDARRREERKKYAKEYREANKERLRAKDREYASQNREEAKARAKAWYYANLERAKAARKAWREANKTSISAASKEDRKANPSKYQNYERKRAAKKKIYNAEYNKKNPEKNRRNQHKRRMILASLPFDTSITTAAVYERDNGVCGLCNQPVSESDATIDHIIPVSRGGAHVWANVHIAHKSCNCSKSNKLDATIWSI